MSMTIEELKSLVQKPNTTFFSDDDNTLLYPFPHQGQMMNVYIQLLEEGEYVRFYIPYYLSLAESSNREGIYLKLLELNRQYKFLKFSVDPSDYEMTVSLEFPIEDGTMTENQLYRCMVAITSVAMEERSHLKTLLSTGIYPSADDPQFTAALEKLLGEEDPALAAGMDPVVEIENVSAQDIMEMDEADINRILEEIEADESRES